MFSKVTVRHTLKKKKVHLITFILTPDAVEKNSFTCKNSSFILFIWNCETTDITSIVDTYHSLNSWSGNSWQRTIFWLLYSKRYLWSLKILNYVFWMWWLAVNRNDTENYIQKKHYQIDLNRPWKWLIIIKDLINTKKFKNKGEDSSFP